MPFMMKGSVLEYVKKNRDTLYFMGNVEVEQVGHSPAYIEFSYLYYTG